MYTLTVNGKTHRLNVEADMPLLWALRDELNLTGSKFGCGAGLCGACSVLIDGELQRSCSVTVEGADGSEVTTIEALSDGDRLSAVQQAWLELDVPQCGYCQSGMIMAVTALLAQIPNPRETDIEDAISNICRCGTYDRVRPAIIRAANILAQS